MLKPKRLHVHLFSDSWTLVLDSWSDNYENVAFHTILDYYTAFHVLIFLKFMGCIVLKIFVWLIPKTK